MPSLTYRTLANFRTSTSATAGAPYFLNEAGKEGMFKYVGLTNKQDDGGMTLVGPKGRTYERILENDTICLNWFGVVPDRPDLATQNALITDRVIKANNYCTVLLRKTPGTNNVYYYNHVPEEELVLPVACLSVCDKIMTVEFEKGVTGISETGYVGAQCYERYAPGYVIWKRVNFSHAGGRDAVKEHGALRDEKGELQVDAKGRLVYGQNWGEDYKIHGLRQWCAGEWHGIRFYGFPGHGAQVWGSKDMQIEPVYQDFAGSVNYWNGDLFVQPDSAEDLQNMGFNGTAVEIEGIEQRAVAWPRFDEGSVSLSYGDPKSTGLETGTKVKGRYARKTREFFADFVQSYALDGLNSFGNCGGCCVHVVGPEANAGTFLAITGWDCGGWGIADESFLGNDWLGYHITTCGNRFNFDGNLPIGAITTGSNENTSAIFWGYCENGDGKNMGPNLLRGNAIELAGFNHNGTIGKSLVNGRIQGFRWQEG